jgi:hypothetical protein
MKLATINSKSPRLRPAESIYRALHQETIRTALDRIGGELHAQYVLTYAPSSDLPPDSFRAGVHNKYGDYDHHNRLEV